VGDSPNLSKGNKPKIGHTNMLETTSDLIILGAY